MFNLTVTRGEGKKVTFSTQNVKQDACDGRPQPHGRIPPVLNIRSIDSGIRCTPLPRLAPKSRDFFGKEHNTVWLYDEVTGKTRMLPSRHKTDAAFQPELQAENFAVYLCLFAGVTQGQMMLCSAAPDAKLLEENGDL